MGTEKKSKGILQGEAAGQAAAGLANRGLKIVKVDPYCIKWPGTGILSRMSMGNAYDLCSWKTDPQGYGQSFATELVRENQPAPK